MKIFKQIFVFATLLISIHFTYAQSGSLDPTFNTIDNVANAGTGLTTSGFWSSAIQSDGKIVIVGNFTAYNGITRNYITRLNTDGKLDASFNTSGTGANSVIFSTIIQSDGKILIGGNFTTYNGTTAIRIARLNANGSLDASFNLTTSLGANGFVYSIAMQPDGKILIGGDFLTYNGTAIRRIARLNSDGSLDASFNVGNGANGTVNSIAIQTDGKILIGGDFQTYKGTLINRIARLNPDGSLDATFKVGTGVNGSLRSIAIQSDGKILIGGGFTTYNDTTINRIARLNTNGSLDANFIPGTGANILIYSMAIQSDGKIMIGGEFTSYNGTIRNRIARLNLDGSLDTSFNPGTGANDITNSISIQSDGKILIGGAFTNFNGTAINRIARLNADGSRDASFNPTTGANNTIKSTVVQSDGKILIGGSFNTYNGTTTNYIARLFSDGSIDSNFNLNGIGANSSVETIGVQSDGKIVIAGYFTSYNGTTINRVARITTVGGLDATFNTTGTGASNGIFCSAVQSDDKIIIGGAFTTYNGTARGYIARLNADGSLDGGFSSSANSAIYSIAVQSDGKIVIVGNFTSYNGSSRNYITRLNTDGSIDAGFNTAGSGTNGAIFATAIQSDGKILIGGGFTSYNGTAINRIARLNTDGTLDSSFDPGTGTNNSIYSMTIQSTGKVVIGGSFNSYNGTSRNRISRINTDGSLDANFNVGTGVNDIIWAMANQSDDRILIGGAFTSYNGFVRTRIARILSNINTAPTDISLSTSAINENVSANSTVGSLNTIDQDAGNVFTYSLVAGTGSMDNSSFQISGNSLIINSSPDFETKSSYSVRIRTTDQGLLTFEKVFNITINDICDIPAPTITPSGTTTFCVGGTVTLTSSAITGNTWSTGATTPSITVNSSGTYTVSYTSGGCSSLTSTGTMVIVNQLPVTPSSIAGIVSVCNGASGIMYSISTVVGATGYSWAVPPGAIISSGASTTGITVTFGNTSGIVSVTPTNVCGNGTISSLSVNVSSSPCLPTSIISSLDRSINISPNPFIDDFNIDLTSEVSGIVFIKIRNSIGDLLKEISVNSTSIKVPMANLPSGVYVIELVTNYGNLIKRAIKE